MRKLITGTCVSRLHTHARADTPYTSPHHIYEHVNVTQTWALHTHLACTHPHPLDHLHSHIIEPIKEMSLISRGVPALVNHRGFLAGAGDMRRSLSYL